MKKNVRVVSPEPKTHGGAPAARISAEAQLRRSVLATFLWEDQFYEDGVTIADRIRDLAQNVPTETVAALAVEAREKQRLRHVPLLLAVALAPRGGKIVGDTIASVIQRADEMGELLSLYWDKGRVPLSKQVKRGLAQAVTEVNRKGGFDRLVVITDEQATDGRVPAPKVPNAYMINVASARNGVGYKDWTHLDGFSENVLRWMAEFEAQKSFLAA